MPEEVKNTLAYQNYSRQMKAPFIIYADFEALIENIPEDQRERTACTVKINKHTACGFAMTCVRSDGGSYPVQKYRQASDGDKNAVEEFLNRVIRLEKKLRKNLGTPVLI